MYFLKLKYYFSFPLFFAILAPKNGSHFANTEISYKKDQNRKNIQKELFLITNY